MSGWHNAMALPVRDLISQPMVEAPRSQATLAADAQARRLAAGVARGDESAFGELYDSYRVRVHRLALVLSHGDQSLAEEAAQTVFLTAAAKLRTVESEEHLWNWLARVTRQQMGKMWRQKQADAAIVGAANLPEFSDLSQADLVLEQQLDAALSEMETADQQLIEWFYFDRLSHKEIAQRLNTSSKAVSSRLERARAKLRSLLNRKLANEL